jgi:hypothetical protein
MTHLFPFLEFSESQKNAAWDLTFFPEASVNKPNQVQRKMAPTTPPSSTLCSGSFGWTRVMEVPQAQWLWPRWQEKNQGKKAPGGLKTLKVSNNFGPAGRQNPPRAAKFNGGLQEP